MPNSKLFGCITPSPPAPPPADSIPGGSSSLGQCKSSQGPGPRAPPSPSPTPIHPHSLAIHRPGRLLSTYSELVYAAPTASRILDRSADPVALMYKKPLAEPPISLRTFSFPQNPTEKPHSLTWLSRLAYFPVYFRASPPPPRPLDFGFGQGMLSVPLPFHLCGFIWESCFITKSGFPGSSPRGLGLVYRCAFRRSCNPGKLGRGGPMCRWHPVSQPENPQAAEVCSQDLSRGNSQLTETASFYPE